MLGVSRQAVHDLTRRGVISVGDDGRIDVADARRTILDKVNPNAKTAMASSIAVNESGRASVVGNDDSTQDSAPTETSHPEAATSYHVARTMREAAEAQISALKLAEMRGDLVRVEAVKSVMASIFSTVRDAILQIPARLAPVLAAESDPANVQNMVHSELHAALESLANAPSSIGNAGDGHSSGS